MSLRKLQSVSPGRVSVQKISKSYDGRRAVSDVTLDVAGGEFLAILGPSGSGKTTVMRVIAGFETPDKGSVFLAGDDVTHRAPEHRDVNMVFQSYALFPHMNVLENVAYGPRMHGVSRREREAKARRMLEMVHLADAAARRPHELSGGMQQRVALARALVNEPAVLLLDEPLGALDSKLRHEMQRELRRIHAELGATFIYVTHDQEEAFELADRLALMCRGRIEQIGTPSELYDRPKSAWAASFVGSANVIHVRVAGIGNPALLHSNIGPLETGYLADGLKCGGAAMAVVRPEATRIVRQRPAMTESLNCVPAHLSDVIRSGPSLRLRAVAADGTVFESLAPREPELTASAVPAQYEPVFVTFPARAVRTYPHEDVP
jgi:ABC-type Fe3+/spermidine/putrescine transport system ATPase subunit